MTTSVEVCMHIVAWSLMRSWISFLRKPVTLVMPSKLGSQSLERSQSIARSNIRVNGFVNRTSVCSKHLPVRYAVQL